MEMKDLSFTEQVYLIKFVVAILLLYYFFFYKESIVYGRQL